jgi:hypothetical protein
MLEFYQTVAGRTFFDGQIPRLVKAIELISGALQDQRHVIAIEPWDHYAASAASLLAGAGTATWVADEAARIADALVGAREARRT